MIPQQTIDAILSNVAIESYIGKEVELKRSGVNVAGCCPFHNEKTPSFVVTPRKGIFKCFGCGEGGNVITWVMKRNNMTFTEAVRKLAHEHSIPFEEREQTPEEKEAAFKRESIFTANEAANIFFTEQLPQCKEAKEYCERRWGKEAVREMELGYAPAGWSATKDHLLSKQYTAEVLSEAGLIKKKEKSADYYDFFRDRITIPIRDKNGRIIGFTARIFRKNDDGNGPKFINTSDTPVFSKGKSLFGIYHAYREAYKVDKVVLVEGAPDVIKMQSIGVYNTVAPLGTALTDEQIALIKRCAKNVVMIPDSDEPGIKAAKRNGAALFKAGLNVTVVLLTKYKDVDEAFQGIQDYTDAIEGSDHVDFVRWFAAMTIADAGQSEGVKTEKIREVCDLLAKCEDESKVDMYIEALAEKHKPRKVWMVKIAEARGEKEAASQTKKHKDNNDTIEKFGFSVENNCYYGLTAKGQKWKWSNFTMTPLAHIRGMNSKRLYVIKNEYGYEQTIEIKQEDLVSLSKFRVKTEGMGNYLWEAGETELHRLKRYLYENTLTCDEITQLGWQKKHGFFAWGNGGVVDGKFIKADQIGILSIEDRNFYLPAFSKIFENDPQLFQFERRFVHAETNGISLYDYAEKLICVFGNNAKIAICFLFSTLYKDLVTQHTKTFPILNLFGPKGTGKSELGHSLMAFFVPGNIPPNISNTTIPALAEAVAQVSNSVVHIDEYKNTIDLDRREFLKGLWDGAGRTRMNMDRDKKRETTTVDSGIVLSGQEMPTADIALFSRLIYLTFYQTTFSEEQRRNFEELKRIERRGLSHLTNELLKFRKVVASEYAGAFKETYESLSERLDQYSIEDRTFKNWVTVVAMLRVLTTQIHLPFTFEEVMDFAADGILTQNEKTKENNELSGFWETIESLVRSVQVQNSVDFKIKSLVASTAMFGFKEKVSLDPEKRYLLLHFNNVMPGYQKECRITGSKVLPKDSLKYYLENSAEFIGIKKSERFKRLAAPNSSATKQGLTPLASDPSSAYCVSTCMVFDYEAIVEHYNISIDEQYTTNIDEEEEGQPNQEAVQMKVPY